MIGLDYKSEYVSFKQKQKEVFLQQLVLAKELNLPVIIHCRSAHEEMIEILKDQLDLRGVVHCFTGNWEQAQKYMDLGFYIGINGIIFKLDLDEVIKKVPLEKILTETDCPYLTPPAAGTERNEPIFVKYVIKKIAEIKNISFEKVADITTQNAKSLFQI